MASKCFEPPAFISKTKTYSTYKADLKRWSRITSVEKKLQAEVVVYNLEGHPSGIKEKIEVKIGSELENNEDGIERLLKFLDTIYQQDEMSDAWVKYKNFQKIARGPKQDISDFILDFDKEYMLAKTAGCVYSDLILAFRLLEASNLSESDEKFVLTGIDIATGKKQENLEAQMKASLKKFQGRSIVTNSSDGIKVDAALVAKVQEVMLGQGWKKPGQGSGRRRSYSNPEDGQNPNNSPNYKGKKNPLGANCKVLTCYKCQSKYHFSDKCDKKNTKKEGV